MEDLVVDSKYGRRPLTEIAPMYPTIQQKQLMQDSFLGEHRPHTGGNFPSQLSQPFSYPIQGYGSPYPEHVPYGYDQRLGPEGFSNYNQPVVGGAYGVPNFRYNPVSVYLDPWGNPVQPGQGMYGRNLATTHGYPVDRDSVQPQFYTHHGQLINSQNHLPHYGRPHLNQLHPMYHQQPFLGSGPLQGDIGSHNRNINGIIAPDQLDRPSNTKPKSAHYFYGPDGGLLSGPGEFYTNLDPPQNRVSQSEPILNHYPEDRQEHVGLQSRDDFLVEVVLKYGKLKSVTVKNSGPNFKTLPEFLVDDLEKHYCRIPETHVVLVAVNGSYSIYASPYTRPGSYMPASRVHTERERPQPYTRHNTTPS